MNRSPHRARRGAETLVWLGIAVALAACGVGAYLFLARGVSSNRVLAPPVPPSPVRNDPRLSYAGPFLNVRPGVKMVGDQACFGCHAEICSSFHKHSMGRSILPALEITKGLPLDAAHHDPFDAAGSRFDILIRDKGVIHRESRLDSRGEKTFERDMVADYAIGSGNNGHSFLAVRGEFLFQTPVSWFSQKQIWDHSPGFQADMHNGRPVTGQCMYCHTNHVDFVAGSMNRYREPIFPHGAAIGCERCHGPGELHVSKRTEELKRELQAEVGEKKIDTSIVNPKHLSPPLREDVCNQCHLEGVNRVVRTGREMNDFRPGIPLADVLTVFVERHEGNDWHAVNHVEQMMLSKCYAGTEGKMGCVTCHDPHAKIAPAERVAHFRAACLNCHADCALPKATRLLTSKEDSCVQCHMPKFSSIDIAHTASTNHLILRKPPPPRDGVGQHAITKPLNLFPNRAIDSTDPEQARDHGITLVTLGFGNKIPADRFGTSALNLLERAALRYPDDVELLQARAGALELLQRRPEALAAYEAVLQVAPDYELARIKAAFLAQRASQSERAIGHWSKAIEANPWMANYPRNLATILLTQRRYAEALPVAERWLKLDPTSGEARQGVIHALALTGQTAEATRQFDALVKQAPEKDRPALAKWFAELKGGR